MKRKAIILFYAAAFNTAVCLSQNIGIGTNSPNSSAALDIAASNKGLLPPRVSLTGIDDTITIVSPATGLLIYNIASAGIPPKNVQQGYYYYNGNVWVRLSNVGNAGGDMQYWDGTQWITMAAGSTGQTLTMCNGIPAWGPCNENVVQPTVTTNTVTNITPNAATAGGNVTSNGGAAVTARGICYSTNYPATLADNVVTAASAGTGTFSVPLTNLSASTIYYTRAFATNSTGTAYGDHSGFSTASAATPSVTTAAAFAIGSNTASCGGTVTDNGGSALSARGIVYGTGTSPTLANSVITDAAATTGSYTSIMNELTAGTQYYARAYATNLQGTSYGNEISFTTLSNGYVAATYTFDSVKVTSGLTDPTPVPSFAGVSFGPFTGTGAGAPSFNSTAAARFSLTNWTLGATNGSDVFSPTDTATRYFEVTISPVQGKSITFSSLSFRLQRSGTGVRQAFVRSSIDNFSANLTALIYPDNTALSVVPNNKFQVTDASTFAQDGCTISLGTNAFTGITTPVTFRFYGINAEAPTGTFSIDNVVFNISIL
ncbi:MAG: hypothetical protein QM791_17380 [Ferruginibacter sp.]